jgi:hypothetical protein
MGSHVGQILKALSDAGGMNVYSNLDYSLYYCFWSSEKNYLILTLLHSQRQGEVGVADKTSQQEVTSG